ncbi:hypothetical protein MW290_04575 [Aquincola tertiaricarbonis]|uniref:Uncharacterized protein n=1 Tax=Aquincola tertiaricarbonis TaxID=391953 RepID=A0ABY4S5B1_AQUTE|nr:hypothetical protein [Aquincola tertiaricarbonis]URI07870.1 hypothetical protein MW290_04575 [Aquincola tertiaricarbonis]|tara:strand:- start:5602 stop:5853 length:252 start_codon:yes stop_codon:yes gene_type:complete
MVAKESKVRQRVTEQDVHQFAGPVVIRDPKAFADQLEAFVQARVSATIEAADQAVRQALRNKAAHLRAETRWSKRRLSTLLTL